MWPFTRKAAAQPVEKRAAGSGFTAEIMAVRESYISGSRGIGELTATAQACVSMWENGFTIADVDGTDLLSPAMLALAGRSLALRGEALFLIRDDGLVPCSDWEVKTLNAKPTAYRVSISEAGGGCTATALAGEVLHFRIGCDPVAPWYGTAPLRRASLTAAMLNAVETALAEVFEDAPIGSQIVAMPETGEANLDAMSRGFRGRRGRLLLKESVNVTAAGGPAPASDWKSESLTLDLQRAATGESLSAARDAICAAFGVLPSLFAGAAQGPLVREAQRHLAGWTLQPVAQIMAREVADKIASPVAIDVQAPLQAYDAGARARAITAVIDALARAKETGVDPDAAMALLDWSKEAEGIRT